MTGDRGYTEKVYVGGRFLCQTQTGVQRFAREICLALDEGELTSVRPPITVLAPRSASITAPFKNLAYRRVGYFEGHLWEQVDLLRHSYDGLLLSLCGSGPLFHPQHVVAVHDAGPFAMPWNYAGIYAVWHRLAGLMLGRRAAALVTVSEFSKEELCKHLSIPSRRITIIPNGADHFAPLTAPTSAPFGLSSGRYVLAVGSSSPHKNISLCVQALPFLRDRSIQLVVAGRPVPRVLADHQIAGNSGVTNLGPVSEEDLAALYNNALCFVFPSLYEGFGIPPLEAMMCGCPVIVSDIPALRETCGDAALYCDPRRPESLARHINSLSRSTRLRQVMRARGRARAARYTWRTSARKLLELVNGVIR